MLPQTCVGKLLCWLAQVQNRLPQMCHSLIRAIEGTKRKAGKHDLTQPDVTNGNMNVVAIAKQYFAGAVNRFHNF